MTMQCTQSGTDFQCSGTADSGESISLSGTNVDGSVNYSFNITNSVSLTGTAGGSFDGQEFNTGNGNPNPNCSSSFVEIVGTNFIPTQVDGDGLISQETPSTTLTSTNLNIWILPLFTTLNTRMQGVTGGNVSRAQIIPTANGLAFEGGISGLNAGDGVISYGAWLSYSYSDFDNDLSSTAYDGDRHTVLGGVDFAPWENTVIGVAVGYEDSDIDTAFNLGNQETDGYTIAPYFGALLTDTWSVNFSFGYSSIDYDQFRTDPTTGTRITSSPDGDRWFGMFNLNGMTTYGNWLLGGRVGRLWAKNEIDAFTESNTTAVADFRSKLGTWNIGGDAAYSFGAFEPFVSATYEYDYSMTEIAVATGPQPDNDRDDVLFAAGVRYFGGNNGISGNLDWTRRLGRSNYDEDMFTLSIRVDF
jgi:hypothetical protein